MLNIRIFKLVIITFICISLQSCSGDKKLFGLADGKYLMKYSKDYKGERDNSTESLMIKVDKNRNIIANRATRPFQGESAYPPLRGSVKGNSITIGIIEGKMKILFQGKMTAENTARGLFIINSEPAGKFVLRKCKDIKMRHGAYFCADANIKGAR